MHVTVAVAVVLCSLAGLARAAPATEVTIRLHDPTVPHEHDGGPCADMPHDCAEATSVAVGGGRAVAYVARDVRTGANSHAVRDGEYLVNYLLVLPAGRQLAITESFVDGGTPNGHSYELCGTTSGWCERIARATPQLSRERKGRVHFAMTTVTRAQRWRDDNPTRGTEVVRRTYRRTVDCGRDPAAGWRCTTARTVDGKPVAE